MILHQWIPHRSMMPRIEVPMTEKISIIKELGILVHMPDGDSLPVRIHSMRLNTVLTGHRFLSKLFI